MAIKAVKLKSQTHRHGFIDGSHGLTRDALSSVSSSTSSSSDLRSSSSSSSLITGMSSSSILDFLRETPFALPLDCLLADMVDARGQIDGFTCVSGTERYVAVGRVFRRVGVRGGPKHEIHGRLCGDGAKTRENDAVCKQ